MEQAQKVRHKKILLASEIAGMFFIVFAGAALHFTFEWSDHNVVVGLFSAVNESVWEHLKLPFFPAVVLGAVQYAFLRKTYPNFFLGKAIGIFSVPVIILSGFYAYEAIFGGHNLAYDIGLFIFSVVVGQVISYKAITKYGEKNPVNYLPLIAIAAYAVIFFVFTVSPPHLELFRDPLSGGFGLEAGHHHH